MSTAIASGPLAALLGDGWRGGGRSATALADGVRALVVDGRLAPRTRVPSERTLADALGVSRGTVSRAYDALRNDGFLRSARGAGSWLELPGAQAEPMLPTPTAPAHTTNLTVAALPAPEPLLSEAAARAAAALPRHAPSAGYAPAGLPELREAIAARCTARGLPTTADQIHVTAGAQHAQHLLLALLTAPGDRALVDAPAYPRTLSAMRRARVRAVGVPLARDGWDVDAWTQAITAVAPRMAVTIADFHNPTGLTMAAEARVAVARACARAGVILVCDETNAELRLDGPELPPPLAANDPGDTVVTIGSTSKAAWGGLRIGWIRASPRTVADLAAIRADVDMASPVLDQLLAVELLADWDAVVATRLTLLRERRDALLAALRSHAPAWKVRRPHGGLSAWVRLPAPIATSLAAAAARERLLITPGPSFAVDGAFEHRVRLPFTAPPQQLDDAVALLAQIAGRVRSTAQNAQDEAVAPAAV